MSCSLASSIVCEHINDTRHVINLRSICSSFKKQLSFIYWPLIVQLSTPSVTVHTNTSLISQLGLPPTPGICKCVQSMIHYWIESIGYGLGDSTAFSPITTAGLAITTVAAAAPAVAPSVASAPPGQQESGEEGLLLGFSVVITTSHQQTIE